MSTQLRKRPVRTRTRSGKDGADDRFGKLDRRTIAQFCDLVRRGLPFDGVCDYLGINHTSYWKWTTTGKKYLEVPESQVPKHLRICVEFVRQTRLASSQYRLERVDLLHGRDPKDPTRKVRSNWVREMTILERRDRKSFSRLDPQGGTEEDMDPDESFL